MFPHAPYEEMEKSLATSRQEFCPKVNQELLLKRGAWKHPCPLPCCCSPPRARQGMVRAVQDTAGLVPHFWNNGIAMPGSSVPRQGCVF